ncbi:signal transduction histidine kinase [Litorivivens lipolytica]|uniref:histidine kinase n=1 Tax=Litorivivens lipolytica TaxID=1524264 RepID=A0A7W4W3B7_9GAMM|nr:ATP-binding protein [Litorivivens lipolytica]MBB3046690.1 signal transduction histidine kinase [Litorivivens lipolytica]
MSILHRLSALPIRHKILLSIIGTSLIVVLLSTAVYLTVGWVGLKNKAVDEIETTANMFAQNVSAALSFGDVSAAGDLLLSLKALTELERACVYDKNAGGVLFASYTPAAKGLQCPKELAAVPEDLAGSLLHREKVFVGQDQLGTVVLQRSTDDLQGAMGLSVLVAVGMVLVSSLIAFLLTSFFRRLIEQPITQLVATTQRVSEESDFGLRAEKFANDEIGTLFDSFNGMLAQIQSRDLALSLAHDELKQQVTEVEEANAALNTTLKQLRETQEQLVNQEKMASLGGLVAGVAHEINTPIGVGVTAASTLHAATEDMSASYEAGRLTDSGLRKYVQTAIQSAGILLNNLNRAANLIHSFKQVAVDQTSSELRQFDLHNYLEEILLSLLPKLKKTNISVELNVPDNLLMQSFPGAFSQIITNLLMNSLVHAYPDTKEGTIRIDVDQEGEQIALHYRDDGVGMDRAALDKVFDPFFTTRRGDGGSGLGMHIVYNLVTQQLRGRIRMDSKPGEGVHVTLQIPQKLSMEEVA